MADEENQQVAVTINPATTPVLYTDNVLMNTNEDGVVLDIAQRIGSSTQSTVVARIGMSREHAKKLVTELGRLLAMTEGKVQTGSNKEN